MATSPTASSNSSGQQQATKLITTPRFLDNYPDHIESKAEAKANQERQNLLDASHYDAGAIMTTDTSTPGHTPTSTIPLPPTPAPTRASHSGCACGCCCCNSGRSAMNGSNLISSLPPPPPPSRYAKTTPTPAEQDKSHATSPKRTATSTASNGSTVEIDVDIDDDWESDWPGLIRGFSGLTSPSNPPAAQSVPEVAKIDQSTSTTTTTCASPKASLSIATPSHPISIAQLAHEAAAIGRARAVARAARAAAFAASVANPASSSTSVVRSPGPVSQGSGINPESKLIPSSLPPPPPPSRQQQQPAMLRLAPSNQPEHKPARHVTMLLATTPVRCHYAMSPSGGRRQHNPEESSTANNSNTAANRARSLAENLYASLPSIRSVINPAITFASGIPAWARSWVQPLQAKSQCIAYDALVTKDPAGRLQFVGCPCACHIDSNDPELALSASEAKQVDGAPTHCCRCVIVDPADYVTSSVDDTVVDDSPKTKLRSQVKKVWQKISQHRVAAAVIPAAVTVALVVLARRSRDSSSAAAPDAPTQQPSIPTPALPIDRGTTRSILATIASFLPWGNSHGTTSGSDTMGSANTGPASSGGTDAAQSAPAMSRYSLYRLRESMIRSFAVHLDRLLQGLRETGHALP